MMFAALISPASAAPSLDNISLVQVGPQCELVGPLVHTDAAGAQHQRGLLHARSSSDTHKGLASTTGQDDDACSRVRE